MRWIQKKAWLITPGFHFFVPTRLSCRTETRGRVWASNCHRTRPRQTFKNRLRVRQRGRYGQFDEFYLKFRTPELGLFGLADRMMLDESLQSVPLSRSQFPELQSDLAHMDRAKTILAFYLKIGNYFKGHFIQIKSPVAENDF